MRGGIDKKTLGLAVALLALALAFLPACSKDNEDAVATPPAATQEDAVVKLDPAAVLAKVNGAAITQGDFDRELKSYESMARREGRAINPEEFAQLESMTLERLINMELLYQEAKNKGLTVTEEAIDSQIEQAQKRFKTEGEFEQMLASLNVDMAGLRNQIERMELTQQLIRRVFSDQIAVSDTEVKDFYETNKDRFLTPAQVRASHILVKLEQDASDEDRGKAREKIEMVEARLKKGEDFAQLAQEFSDCPSASRGGDLGFFSRGRMVKPFEDAAFALKKDELSPITQTQFGFHIIKQTGEKPEELTPLDKAAARIKYNLKQSKLNQMVQENLARLKDEAKLEILTEKPVFGHTL